MTTKRLKPRRITRSCPAALAAAAASRPASAGIDTSVGPGGCDWNTAANCCPSDVPDAGHDVVICGGGVATTAVEADLDPNRTWVQADRSLSVSAAQAGTPRFPGTTKQGDFSRRADLITV